jgi:isoquinoline 1-oxidoreductase beta subunit
MLVQAAATQWNVAPSACRAENNSVINTASNARLTYGSLAEAASKLPVPASPTLKDPAQYKILSKPVKRLDTPSKVDGAPASGSTCVFQVCSTRTWCDARSSAAK